MRLSTITCRKCGTPNRKAAKFCRGCGNTLAIYQPSERGVPQEEWPDQKASVPVADYRGATYAGNIDVTLSRVADEDTLHSGTLLLVEAAKEYIAGVEQGKNPEKVLAAILQAHESDGTWLQIDPENPNRREIRDFCIQVYHEKKR